MRPEKSRRKDFFRATKNLKMCKNVEKIQGKSSFLNLKIEMRIAREFELSGLHAIARRGSPSHPARLPRLTVYRALQV